MIIGDIIRRITGRATPSFSAGPQSGQGPGASAAPNVLNPTDTSVLSGRSHSSSLTIDQIMAGVRASMQANQAQESRTGNSTFTRLREGVPAPAVPQHLADRSLASAAGESRTAGEPHFDMSA